MVSNGFPFYTFQKFSLVLNTTVKVMSISNVGGVTHSHNLSRLYLHKQSLETPTHVDSPPLLKSILLLAI